MKTRINDWFNPKTLEVSLGIDVKTKDTSWQFYAEDNKIYYAKSEDEREAKRKELRKL